MFYLNQIGVHDNQLCCGHRTGTALDILQCRSIAPFYSWRKIHSMVQTFSLLERYSKKKVLSSKSNSVISWKEVTNRLTYFATIKIMKRTWIETSTTYVWHFVSILWRRKRKENREMRSVLQSPVARFINQ